MLAVALGALLARRAQQQIDAIDTTLVAAAAGRLDERIARTHRGDDLDRVAGRINGTLDQLQRVIGRLNQAAADIAHDLKRPLGRTVGEVSAAPYRQAS